MSCVVPFDMRWVLALRCLQRVWYQPVIVPHD